MFLPASLGNALPRAPLPAIDESLWYPATTPPAETVVADNSAIGVNLGVLFTVGVNGTINSVCYWRWDARQSPNGSVAIWQVDHGLSTLLAKVDFTGHTGTGWQKVDLPVPVECEGRFAYKASVWLPQSADGFMYYTGTKFFFQTKSTYSQNNFITAWLADGRPDPRGFVRANAFYKYGAFAIPTEDFYQSNYWIDVVVHGSPPPDPPLPPLNLKWPIPPGYPTFDNTGVPVGTVLTPYQGDFYSTADGQIIENLSVTKGAIIVQHNDVTVRKCKVVYNGNNLIAVNTGFLNVTIEDCELDGMGRHNNPCNGIAGGPLTVRRCNIYRVENGFYSYGYPDQDNFQVIIEDNFIHNLFSGPGGPPHYDGIQMDGGQGNCIIRHNTVFCEHGDTSAIMLDNEYGRLYDILLEDNLVGGGGYTLYCVTQSSEPGANPITNIQYYDNKMHSGLYGYFTTRPEAEIFFAGNQHLDHGGVFDQPSYGGFVEGQVVPESFYGFRFDVTAGINGDAVEAATGGVTLGISFTPSVDGVISGVNFFRPGQSSTTTYKVGLWRYTGSNRLGGTELLASQEFTEVSRPNMVNMEFTTPVAVSANDNLVVGLFIPRGNDGNCWYMVTAGEFWPDAVPSQWGRLTAFSNNSAQIVNGFASCNGTYAYGPDLTPPTGITGLDSNYWVDPVFVAPWAGETPPAIVAPAFRSIASTTYVNRNDTIIPVPAGVVLNDILIAGMVYIRSPAAGTDLVVPGGWTQIGAYTVVTAGGLFAKMGLWWKRATASEPADYTWAQFESANTQGMMLAYSGCPTSGSPVDAFSQNSANTGATATATSINASQDHDMLLYLGHNWDGAALLPPTGMTERFDAVAYASDEVITAVGATGNRTQTLATSNPWAAFLVALKGG